MRSAGLLLHNATLVLPTRLLEGALIVRSGRITAILERPRALPPAETVIDLEGNYLAPGFIDLHIHGSRGVDVMTATPSDLAGLAAFLMRNGTTRFLPTTVPGTDSTYLHAVSVIEQVIREGSSGAPSAAVMGIHYEGPFINSACHGALDPGFLKTYRGPADLGPFLAEPIRRAGGVVMMTLAPEIEGGLDLITALKQAGIITAIGHSQASWECCEAAFALGARHLTHFPNALAPLHHRRPGVAGWGLFNQEVTLDVIADGFHVNPQMLRLIRKNKTASRMGLISDAISACGMGDGAHEVWGEEVAVHGGRTSKADGRLAGSVITMLDAVSNLAGWGFPLVEVSRMASHVPACVLGLSDELGSIEVGKRADLVAFDRGFKVTLVAVDGRVADLCKDHEKAG